MGAREIFPLPPEVQGQPQGPGPGWPDRYPAPPEFYAAAGPAERLTLQAVMTAEPAPCPSSPHRGDTTADRMAHVLRGKLDRGEAIDAEAIDGILELVTAPKPVATEADREWARQMARDLPPVTHRGDVMREAVAREVRRIVATAMSSEPNYGRDGRGNLDIAADAILALLPKAGNQ